MLVQESIFWLWEHVNRFVNKNRPSYVYMFLSQVTLTLLYHLRTASYFCRISGWLDVTVWMLGRGLTGRQSQQSNKCPLTRRDLTPQEASALRQQSWRSVRLKWARCSELLPNSTRKWAHWSPRGNTREKQSRALNGFIFLCYCWAKLLKTHNF